jgi:hypothetical protein
LRVCPALAELRQKMRPQAFRAVRLLLQIETRCVEGLVASGSNPGAGGDLNRTCHTGAALTGVAVIQVLHPGIEGLRRQGMVALRRQPGIQRGLGRIGCRAGQQFRPRFRRHPTLGVRPLLDTDQRVALQLVLDICAQFQVRHLQQLDRLL